MKYINLEYHPADSRVRIVDDDVVQTLRSRMGTGGSNVPIILVLNDQGGAVINWSKEELSPTIRAQDHGHPPVVVMEDEADSSCNSRSGRSRHNISR